MLRENRKKSNSGIYHIMLRGINRQQIFEDDEDYSRFLETLAKYREECGYSLYGYCLMPNHVHLVLREGKQPLETIMRRESMSRGHKNTENRPRLLKKSNCLSSNESSGPDDCTLRANLL